MKHNHLAQNPLLWYTWFFCHCVKKRQAEYSLTSPYNAIWDYAVWSKERRSSFTWSMSLQGIFWSRISWAIFWAASYLSG